MLKYKQWIIGGVAVLVMVAFVTGALRIVYNLHESEKKALFDAVSPEEESNQMFLKENIENNDYVDIYFKNIRDVDIKRGTYAMEAVIDFYFKDAKMQPEINFNNGKIGNKKVITKENLGKIFLERQKLVSGHIFRPNITCYPLDTQVLTYEMVSKTKKGEMDILVRNISVEQNENIGSYKIIESGIIGKKIKENANQEQLGLRAFLVLRNNSFVDFVKFYAMLIFAFILAVMSFFVHSNAKFGMGLAAALISASSISTSLSKVPDVRQLTYVEVAGMYYMIAFLIYFVLILLYAKNDKKEGLASKLMYQYIDKAKDVEVVIAENGGNEALLKIKEDYEKQANFWSNKQKKLEQRLEVLNFWLLSIVFLFGTFFVGSYLILSL